MNPEVSIIVPVYSVEKYLPKCIESIMHQTFTSFELILVDDGSPDNCGEICDAYAKKDSRIEVIHKKNGGLSSARNAGMKVAQGKYILFCDSDDYVSPHWVEGMYHSAEMYPGACVVCDLKKVSEGYDASSEDISIKAESVVSYFELYKMGLSGYSVNKIYNANVLRRNHIFFDEQCRFAEDVEFCVKYIQCCDKIILIDDILYFYLQRESSILGKYYPNWFELHLHTFYCRLPLMNEQEIQEYCDLWIYSYHEMFKNVFDARNSWPFLEKMRYNQKMAQTKEFKYVVEHASGQKESKMFMRIMRTHNYYLIWLFDRLIDLKKHWRKKK